MLRPLVLFEVWLVLGPSGLAQEVAAPRERGAEALQRFLEIPVTVATKDPRSMAEAPAVVTVLTRNDLLKRGVRSVAEALESVPGLYAIEDGVTSNFGVRGINGGQRAYGRILKVLLDGQPVDFHSDASNFLGPELIPIEAVDRIEVVRGPASALYGANAFLGVVNILTRSGGGGEAQSAILRVQGQRNHWSSGLEGFLSAGEDAFGGMLTFSGSREDRSGQGLPASSPLLLNTTPPDRESRNDIAQPRSFYARSWFKPLPELRVELASRYSRLDAMGEWLDFGYLRHDNRVVVEQGFTRLSAQWETSPGLRFNGYLARTWGQPGSAEDLDTGSARPRRDFGFGAWESGVEAIWNWSDALNLVAGVDGSEDRERLMRVFVPNASGGETLVSQDQGAETFRNLGVYAQGTLRLWRPVAMVLNLRRDWPNHFEAVTSSRAGVIVEVREGLTTKLLYGTAFKAPSAFQFHAQPLTAGDEVGNPALRPERATTWEGEVRWRALPELLVNLNVFRNRVSDKVEFVPAGTGSQPINQGPQASTGFEMEGRLTYGPHQLYGNVAWQRSEDIRQDPFLGELRSPTTLYPGLMGLLQWRWAGGPWGDWNLGMRWVGERRASKSNIQKNYYEPYTLGGYSTLEAAWTRTWGPHRVQFRGRNLLDRRYADPGFNGLDVPGPSREWGVAYAFTF